MGKYVIVVETTNNKETAQRQYQLLSKNNINPDIRIYKTDRGELYRVEVGPYSMKKQMFQDIDNIKGLGMINAFITRS